MKINKQLLFEVTTKEKLTHLYSVKRRLVNDYKKLNEERQKQVRNGIDAQKTVNQMNFILIKIKAVNKQINSFLIPSAKNILTLGPIAALKPIMNAGKVSSAYQSFYLGNQDSI